MKEKKRRENIRSTVRNAAKFAVYDDIIIIEKNQKIPPTMHAYHFCGQIAYT